MTDHPCKGLSKTAIEIFELIGTGQTPPYNRVAINVLERRGLIIKTGERVLTRDRFGEVKVPVYEVPIPIHMQWCQWCAENVKDEDDE